MPRHTRIRLAVTAVSALLATAALVQPAEAGPLPLPGLAAQVTPPQDDPFYTPPRGLKGKTPGTVLRSRQVDVSSSGYGLGTPVDAWQVLYRSTSATHRANAVSGTVMVPTAPWTGDGPRPVVSYAVGTHGLGPECAPSYKLVSGTEREFNVFNQALSKGWAVVVTDYEGLGTPGPHTYVAGRALGHAMLDAARAAQRLPGTGLAAGAPIGLWGYSEGGFATGWAAESAAGYAPDLNVVGAAVGAAPADVEAMARLHDGGPASALVLAGAVGLAKAFPSAPFEEILNDAGRQMVADISVMCTEEMSYTFPLQKLDSYTTVADPMSLPEWQQVFDDIQLGNTAPKSPVMIYHSPADELVIFDQGIKLHTDWCAAGAGVQLRPIVGEHITGAIAGSPIAVDYLAGRFSGQDAPSTCGILP